MKQSEKYEILQFALRYCFEENGIYELIDDKLYHIGDARATGREIKDIWNKLLWFRDEARNREKLEEEGGQDE